MVGQILRRAYRLQRIQFRTFKSLYRAHSLELLISTIAPFYDTVVQGFNVLLNMNDVVMDILATQWSCDPILQSSKEALYHWAISEKKKHGLVDVLLFRDKRNSSHFDGHREGLLFPGLQDGSLSPDNVLDINLWLSTLKSTSSLDSETVNTKVSEQRVLAIPDIMPTWDSVIQTSSSLVSTLSFGAVPAKSSLSTSGSKNKSSEPTHVPMFEGLWIVGGNNNEGQKLWLEAGTERPVPISLGNQQPDFFYEQSGEHSEEDNLIQVELFVYRVYLNYFLY
jgi:hypothetical protein